MGTIYKLTKGNFLKKKQSGIFLSGTSLNLKKLSIYQKIVSDPYIFATQWGRP